MRATLTGATGLLGANLAGLLVERGWTVTGTRRASSDVRPLADLPIRWVEAPPDASPETSAALPDALFPA